MNAELEKLIDFALADGVITDKEREIIRKKAEKLGEDPDEAEMILDAKLAMQNKETAASAPPSTPPPVASALPTPPPPSSMPPPNAKQKSSKVGNIMTCPACGATVNAMELNCSECGHEFRNVESSDNYVELKNHLNSIEKEVRERHEKPSGFFNKMINSLDNLDAAGRSSKQRIIRGDINSEQAIFLNNYQIKASKGAIKEVLTLATGIITPFEKKLEAIKQDNQSIWGLDLDVKAEITGLEDIITAWKTCVSKAVSIIEISDMDKEEKDKLLNLSSKIN